MKWLILEFGLISSIIITLYPYDRSVANVVSEWREGGKGDDWSEGETTESTKVVWFLVYLVNDSLVCVSLIPSTSLGSLVLLSHPSPPAVSRMHNLLMSIFHFYFHSFCF